MKVILLIPISVSGCGPVGRSVAPETRDPWFGSSQSYQFFEQNCVERIVTKRQGIVKKLKIVKQNFLLINHTVCSNKNQ